MTHLQKIETSHVAGFTAQPPRHWTARNMRLFMENFAKQRNMDPLVASTWYTIQRDIYQSKVTLYSSPFFQALLNLPA
jgi:hypothetical protein